MRDQHVSESNKYNSMRIMFNIRSNGDPAGKMNKKKKRL